MSKISLKDIKKLRDETGAGLMEVRVALEEAGGKAKKAKEILKKLGVKKAAKRGDKATDEGFIFTYVHQGRIGAMVKLLCETDFVADNEGFKTLARDIAMHVTATNPKFLNKTDIHEADMKSAREVFEAEVKDKPAAMKDKILKGKLDTYFAEMVLSNQPFIKNQDITIQGLVDAAVQKFGEKIAVARFKRFKVLEN